MSIRVAEIKKMPTADHRTHAVLVVLAVLGRARAAWIGGACAPLRLPQPPRGGRIALQDTVDASGDIPPPPRSATSGGYTAPPELVTWAPFTYATPDVRRDYVRECVRRMGTAPELPPLRVALIGGVASGKATIAPMISQAAALPCPRARRPSPPAPRRRHFARA